MSRLLVLGLGEFVRELFSGDGFAVDVFDDSVHVHVWHVWEDVLGSSCGRWLHVVSLWEDGGGFHSSSAWGCERGRAPGVHLVAGKFVCDFEWADPDCLGKLEELIRFYGMGG